MRNWYSRYEQWLSKRIVLRYKEDRKLLPRAAAVFLMNLMGVSFSFIFSLFFLIQGDFKSILSFGSSGIWGLSMQLAFLFGLIRARVFFHLFILTVALSGINSIYMDGGLGSPFMPWIVMPPIVSYLLLGKRGFGIWTLFAFATFAFFLTVNPPEPPPDAPSQKALLSYFALFIAQIITLIFILRARRQFDQLHHDLLKDLGNSQRRAFERGISEERRNVSNWLNQFIGPILEDARKAQTPLISHLEPDKKADLRSDLDQIQQELTKVLQDLGREQKGGIGIQYAIQHLSMELEKGLDLKVHLELPSEPVIQLNASNIHYFRIVQEAFRNIAKHADAQNVYLKLEIQEGHISKLSIRDDGTGFSLAKFRKDQAAGLGLQNMEDRTTFLGGSMRVFSQLGRGTALHFSFHRPLMIDQL